MVRVAGENLLGSVYLLQKHDSRKKMRPCLAPETDLLLGLASDLRRQPVGAADDELQGTSAVSYTHLRAHETVLDLVCRLLLEKKNTTSSTESDNSNTRCI